METATRTCSDSSRDQLEKMGEHGLNEGGGTCAETQAAIWNIRWREMKEIKQNQSKSTLCAEIVRERTKHKQTKEGQHWYRVK